MLRRLGWGVETEKPDGSEIVLSDTTKQKIQILWQRYSATKGEFDNYLAGLNDALGLDGTWRLDMTTFNLITSTEFERREAEQVIAKARGREKSGA